MEENKEIKENNERKLENQVDERKENVQKEETNNQRELFPNKKNGIIVGLIIIVFILAIGLIYVLFFYKDENKPDNNKKDDTPITDNEPNPTPSFTPVPQEDDTEKKYELTVYKYKDEDRISNYNDEEDFLEEAFKIKTASKDAKIIAIDSAGFYFILYNDNGLYLYNIKTKQSQKVELDNNYKDYQILLNENEDKVIGVGYLKSDNKIGYYSLKTNKKLYDGKYKAYSPAGESNLEFVEVNDNYVALRANKGTYLLNSNDEKEVLSYKYDEEPGGAYNYVSYKSGSKYIYAFMGCITEYCGITSVYDDNFKEIYSGEVSSDLFSFYNDNIYLANSAGENKSVIKKLNTTGKEISSSEKDYEIYMIEKNYSIYNSNNKIILENIDDANDSKEVTELKENQNYNEYDSAYYSRKVLDSMGEKDKKEGIYIVIDYEEKDSNGNYGMEYCYTSDKQIVEYAIKQEMGGRAKPVLYLYPTEETNVKVEFDHPEYLTTTYPKYINSWNVTVKPNGDMKDNDGKYYYALYWDEKRYSEVDFKEGFYVESKDAIKFLEEKISIIGLNDKEKNEFIMYWLPIMEANGKNLVYFELSDERESSNKLIISPKPDSLLRVSIHIKKVNEKVNIKEQKLPTFTRVGFVAIEWGGMTY